MQAYTQFKKINGKHSFRESVPNGYVDYAVRKRSKGKVFYFNFDLAQEMGLIPKNHPSVLNPMLCKSILDTFSLVIINEYDELHNTRFPKKDIKPEKYMATRYLQLQHPDKRGMNSGDGRSIWNGLFKGRNGSWDISSCGTGATRLSPATSIEKKFFKTGSKIASYGCGRSELIESVCAGIMSEIFYHNKIRTERTLAIIDFGDGTSIDVRAYKSLLRPAHLFYHVKQANYSGLKGAVDYYIDSQIENGEWPKRFGGKNKYEYFLDRITEDFASVTAHFESEYIFCWLDWDGDNILMDGGIIDYGSVRQFGLFHREYRYDDVERMSTTITEQKNKSKYIVQTCAQIVDYLNTGKKKRIDAFRNHKCIKEFNSTFEQVRDEMLLYKIGFDKEAADAILRNKKAAEDLRRFRKIFSYFESAISSKGKYNITDGITCDAIFCMRDILRELPALIKENEFPLGSKEFVDILKSNYATRKDIRLYNARDVKIRAFQKQYIGIIETAARLTKTSMEEVLDEIIERSSLINKYDRITGDAIISVANKLIRNRKSISINERHRLMADFITQQIVRPEYFERCGGHKKMISNKKAKSVYSAMVEDVRICSEGI
ncbi:MAG: hypothetical protein KAS48_01230 [Gammaproteobacteria bacterium]|nr:hypothetical protein [Gammaproteobacteria bacterium]